MNDADHEQSDPQPENDPPYTYLQFVKVFIDAFIHEIQSATHKQNETRDPWIKRGAWAAMIYTLFTFFIMLGAGYQGIISRQAVIAATEAAEAARQQVENMDRPWVKLIDLKRPILNFVGPGMTRQFGIPNEQSQVALNITPQIKNVGRTTAVHVHVRPQLVIHKWENEWGEFSKEQQAACTTARDMVAGYDATLFPDDPFEGFGTGDQVILSASNISTNNDIKYVAPAIVGCIDYQFGTSQRHHQTRFIYEMFRAGNRSRIFVVGADVNEDAILLVRDPQHDYAD
jgi:hypothetical protein